MFSLSPCCGTPVSHKNAASLWNESKLQKSKPFQMNAELCSFNCNAAPLTGSVSWYWRRSTTCDYFKAKLFYLSTSSYIWSNTYIYEPCRQMENNYTDEMERLFTLIKNQVHTVINKTKLFPLLWFHLLKPAAAMKLDGCFPQRMMKES